MVAKTSGNVSRKGRGDRVGAPDIPARRARGEGQHAVAAEDVGASDFHLLLAHQPKLAREAAATGAVDLQVSGHTHGGHIVGMDR